MIGLSSAKAAPGRQGEEDIRTGRITTRAHPTMYAPRVHLFADAAQSRILRVLQPAQAARLIGLGQAKRLCSGRRIRALVLTGHGGSDPDPMSSAVVEHLTDDSGVSTGHTCYALRLATAQAIIRL